MTSFKHNPLAKYMMFFFILLFLIRPVNAGLEDDSLDEQDNSQNILRISRFPSKQRIFPERLQNQLDIVLKKNSIMCPRNAQYLFEYLGRRVRRLPFFENLILTFSDRGFREQAAYNLIIDYTLSYLGIPGNPRL